MAEMEHSSPGLGLSNYLFIDHPCFYTIITNVRACALISQVLKTQCNYLVYIHLLVIYPSLYMCVYTALLSIDFR